MLFQHTPVRACLCLHPIQGSDDDDDGDDGSGSEEQEGAGRAKGGKADNSRGQQRAPQTTSRKPAGES